VAAVLLPPPLERHAVMLRQSTMLKINLKFFILTSIGSAVPVYLYLTNISIKSQ
jgi:hypothetical protein